MSGKHTIFDIRRVNAPDSRNISPAPTRPDNDSLQPSVLEDRGVHVPEAMPETEKKP